MLNAPLSSQLVTNKLVNCLLFGAGQVVFGGFSEISLKTAVAGSEADGSGDTEPNSKNDGLRNQSSELKDADKAL